MFGLLVTLGHVFPLPGVTFGRCQKWVFMSNPSGDALYRIGPASAGLGIHINPFLSDVNHLIIQLHNQFAWLLI